MSTGAAVGPSGLPPSPEAGRAAAFFDVDNTLMVGASIYYLARGLAARKYFTTKDLRRFAWQQVRFRVSGESHDHLHRTRDNALAFVAGKSVREIVELGEQIYDESMADKIYSGTVNLARAHLERGEPVYLVTATPVDLARVVADRLGLTGALGTVAEREGDRFTGRLVSDVLHGEAKAEAVQALALQEGFDLAACSAYSDSINDVPMLSAVGHAYAVNPDSALRDEARRRGWQIRDFRTGRKAARLGALAGVGLGVAAGAVGATVALQRRGLLHHAASLAATLVGRRTPVNARRNDAAAAGGRAWSGWSPARGR